VDKENRYNDFRIVALPYPGCEFFKDFRENNHSGDGLIYDWSHPQVDTGLGIPDESSLSQLKIDWTMYQVKFYQLYLKTIIFSKQINTY